MGKALELIDQKFGRLTVIARAGKNKWNHPLLWCLCDCGEYTITLKSSLKKGDSKSCGCLKRSTAGKHVKTHGQSKKLIYWVWANMKARCFYKKHIEFENYGGRGITVCDRWLKFENFIKDMGQRPSDKHTLERIQNNKNYEPNNCVWVVQSINNRNKRIYKSNKTGYSGVRWEKKNKAYIVMINKIYIGLFKNLPDAIIARKDAEIKHWGKNG